MEPAEINETERIKFLTIYLIFPLFVAFAKLSAENLVFFWKTVRCILAYNVHLFKTGQPFSRKKKGKERILPILKGKKKVHFPYKFTSIPLYHLFFSSYSADGATNKDSVTAWLTRCFLHWLHTEKRPLPKIPFNSYLMFYIPAS